MGKEAEIGKRIRKARKRKGYSLVQLAEKTEFSQGYLSKIENSDKSPPVSKLLRLARTLEIGVSELLGETEEHKPICLITLQR